MKRLASIAIATTPLALVAPAAFARDALPPVHVEVVDDAVLDTMTGKYMGANMLVGLRIEVISSVRTADGGTAGAHGTLQVVSNGSGGFDVAVDSRSSAGAGAGGASSDGLVSGGDDLGIGGIGQVVQIAGDGNAHSNLASITFTRMLPDTSGFNGLAQSESGAGEMTARISFTGEGMSLQLTGPGAVLSQSMTPGGPGSDGRFMQVGQLFGDNIAGGNVMQLSLLTEQMSAQALHQMGTRIALSGLGGL